MEVSCSSQLYPIIFLLDLSEYQRTLNRAAAAVLAAAVSQLCPGVYPIEGREEPIGFSYDFIFTHPFSEKAFPLIEERMRQWIQEDIPIQMLEMIPQNARELFRHRRRYYPAHFVKHIQDPLVTVFQLGEFVDLCPAPYPDSTSEIGVVKLLDLSECSPLKHQGKSKIVHRIRGCAFSSKDDLKQFLKEREKWLAADHRVLGEKLGLFEITRKRGEDQHEMQTLIWRGAGEKALYQLEEIWRKAYQNRHFELTIGPAKEFFEKKLIRFAQINRSFSQGEIDPKWGLYHSKDSFEDRAWISCDQTKVVAEIISSLKFLEKIPKIFDLKAELVVSYENDRFKSIFEMAFKACNMTPKVDNGAQKSQISWLIFDCFGRKWAGPFLELKCKGNDFRITESIFGCLQRFLALILESGEKDLSQKKHILSRLKDFNIE